MKRVLLLLAFLLATITGFAQSDIVITNTNYQTTYIPGTSVVYVVTVKNNGPSGAANITFINPKPSGITTISWTGPYNSGGSSNVSHTIPFLTSGESVNYIITVQIPNTFTGNLTNIATTKCNAPECVFTDPNASNNTGVMDVDTEAVGSDLVVTNTNNQTIYSPGTSTVYTVVVKNNGPLAASNVQVSNPIPAGITNFSWTGSNGSSGTNVPLANTITTLAKNALVTYTINLDIPPAFTGNLVSQASVTTTSTDPNLVNNTATDTDVVATGADIVIVNTDGSATYTPGASSVYTVTVTNNGPNTANNVQVTNAIPNGITQFSWTGSNGSSGSNIPLSDVIATLADGATVTYTITIDVPDTYVGVLKNQTVVTSATTDPYPNCDQCTDYNNSSIVTTANISITNTDGQSSYVLGQSVTYTVTVKNNGPDTATNVHVIDAIPAGITNFSWSGSNGSSGTNVDLDDTIGVLENGATVVYTITVQVPLTFTGNLKNEALVTSSTTDPSLANNNSVDTDVLAATGADVVIVNTNNQGFYTPGTTTVYTVTVTNNGPQEAFSVSVSNPIPAGIPAANFSWTGNAQSGTGVALTNLINNLPVGSTVTYTVTIDIPLAFTGNLVSTATVSAPTPDPNSGSNQSIDTDYGQADVVVTNTNGQNVYVPGTTVTYDITVTNNGPQNATSVLVTNPIPSGVTNFSWSGNGVTNSPTALNNTIATLTNGQVVTYTVTFTIPLTYTGNLTSQTVVKTVNDSDLSSNTATDIDVAGVDDVAVAITNNIDLYVAGDTSVYTVTVTNNGLLAATDILVNTIVPVGIVNYSWTGNAASGTGAIANTIATLASGASVTYTITVEIPVGFTGDLVNQVSITSVSPDTVAANNQATDTDTQITGADLVVTNTDGFANYIAGQTRTYTIKVTNYGPEDAVNVVVQDLVPAGIPSANVSWTGNAQAGTGNLVDTIPVLAVGQSLTYTFIVSIPSNFPQDQNLINEVIVSTDTPDPNPGCALCEDIDTPNPFADLVAFKTDNQTGFLLDQNNSYSIIVSNNGPSDAVNVVVTDLIPNGITNMSWISSNGASGTGALNDVLPTLAVGQTVTYLVTVKVPEFFYSVTGNLVNTVTVDSDTPDPVFACPTCSDIDEPRPEFVTVDSDTYTVTQLVRDILINEPCVNVFDFTSSSDNSFGYFHQNNSDFPIKDGVIIRSGIAAATEGKYNGATISTTGSGATDADLQAILTANNLFGTVQDASYVQFKFVPTAENFSFNFLFSAMEYGQFQCGYFDAFAFILTDLTDPTIPVQNLAVVPGTSTAVTVQSIRDNFYNGGCADANVQYFGQYNSSECPTGNCGAANVAASDINIKGQSTVMTASATVIPNHVYKIKLVISDYNDSLYDSAVFIEAGSFNIGGPKITGTDLYADDEDFSGPNAVCEGTVRTIRAATEVNPDVTYVWKKDGVIIDGADTFFIEVSEPGVYTVTFFYGSTDCEQSDDIVVEFMPSPFPVNDAEDLYACQDATPLFDLTDNVPTVLDGTAYDETDFDIYYFTSLAAADDPVGVPIDPSLIENYPGADGDTIYMKLINVFTGGYCDPVKPFQLFLTPPPTGGFSYPDDGGDPGYCIGSNISMLPIAPGLTAGGTYTATPAGLSIVDSATGEINLNTSLAGTYTVTYDFTGLGCDPFQATTQVFVEACIDPVASNSGNVCEGTPTFDLYATGSDPLVTYEWTDYNGNVFSNVQNPVGVIVPSTPGSYVYTVVGTIGGVDSDPSSTTLIVHPTPTAEFVSVSSTICTNSNTTLIFTGTPGSTITFNDGNNDIPVLVDAAGNAQYTTPTLSSDVTYNIVSAMSNTSPACEYVVLAGTPNTEVTISVGLPTATLVGFADPVICSGTATTFTIQGTPGATVTYTINGATPTDEEIPVGGTIDVPTGNQTVAADTVYTYELISIVSNSTPPCSNTISGQTADLTVNALPTASFTTSTPTVCEGTSAILNFTGTPNATVTYTDGGTTFTTVLDATGVSVEDTPVLADPTQSYTFTLVSVSSTSGITCSSPLTQSLTIDVDANPVITDDPDGDVVCIGESITLNVTATGDNLSYQWFNNAGDPVGTDSASFTIASPTNADAGDYTVVVTGSCGTPVTSAIATLTVNEPTIITTEPVASTTVCEGDAINLSVVATGINLTYQWKKGGTPIPAPQGTSTTLNIASATLADAGTYTCDIINPCQTITTQNAVVIVNELPSITTDPVVSTTICSGEGISLSVVATGTNLTYQWYLNGGTALPAPAGTSATYTDASVTIAEAGDYTVVVSGACTPPVTSTISTVVVNEGPTFTLQPNPTTVVCSGDVVTLTVATTGGTNVTYQWQDGNGNNIPGAINATYTIASAVVGDTGTYTCVVSSDSCPDITSDAASVTVNQAPAITGEPVSRTICVGETVSFTIVATGTNVAYQWYKGPALLTGETSNVYTIASATEADSGDYTCVVSSTSCPDVTSAVATLLVNPLPVATISNGTPSTICSGESTQVIFEGTPGAVVIYTINGGLEETITLGTGPTILPTGTLTETTTYTLLSVTYTGVDACSQPLTGSAVVTVNELPEVSLEDGYICIDPVTLATTRTYILDTGLSTGDYTFEWSDANGVITGATNSFYEAGVVGQYGVKIMDIVTLCEQTAFANVYQSSPPTDFDYTVNGYFAQNPTVIITAEPVGDYEYQLDYGPFQESNVFDNITSGTHTITVRDAQACDVLTKEVTIIDYPKYFTPNGDGFHDTWNISTLSNQPNAKIYIFDRFGKLVKEISTTGLGWDGTYNGQPLPATDYWFNVTYQEAGIIKEFKAHFSLKR